MVKYKIKKKKNSVKLIVTAKSEYQICEREAYAINGEGVKGMLKFETEYRKSSFSLVYDITGLMTLEQILMMSINKEYFLYLIECLVNNLKVMERTYISNQMVLLGIQNVMVNPSSGEIWFVCVPVQGYDSGMSLRKLLIDISRICRFSDGCSMDFFNEYSTIISRGVNLSLFDLEEYICRMRQTKEEKRNTNEKSVNSSGPQMRGTYDPFKKQTGKASEGSLYLIHMSDNSRVSVRSFPFVIGRSAGDYFISGNAAVSKRHAEIILHDNQYFVRDLGSVNHTYVDGIDVRAGTKMKLSSGCRLQIANEEFVCRIE